ncbi:MAG: sugar transferase [Lachnospiraceae bacterium]|nr:sugar transferase [Lachnospiraceae bacterium]
MAQIDVQRIDKNEVVKSRKVYWFFKRLQDIVFSAIGLVVLSPVLLVIALLVYLDDPKGSPIFSQKRCGRKGKEFDFYKFRSMYVDAESKLGELLDQNEMEGPAFKIKNDPRITRLGRFLRKTGLDELPQFVNILKGDMSIVGPRPPLPREVEQYNDYQKQRLMVTPGLTCYWQIQPHRNELTFDEWMDLDIKYIYERSFWIDWKIILATVRTVLEGRGE